MAAIEQNVQDWDERKLLDSLARLEDLEVQVQQLRSGIKDIVQSYISIGAQSSEVAYFKKIAETAKSKLDDLALFKAAWQDDRTREVLGYTERSRKANVDMSVCAPVPEYGWKREQQRLANEKPVLTAVETLEQDLMSKYEEEDDSAIGVETIVRSFKQNHADLSVDLERTYAGHKVVIVNPKLKKWNKFEVWIKQPPGGCWYFKSVPDGNYDSLGGRMKLDIFLSIDCRLRKRNLRYLLDMTAAYLEIPWLSKCRKCDKLVDGMANVPTGRRYQKLVDGTSETGPPPAQDTWAPYHHGCLPPGL